MLGQRFARGALRLVGWTLVDDLPERPPKFVLIGAPHTTNWDFPFAILMFIGLGMKRNWVGKHTLFQPPLGWLMRALGGVPLDRSKRSMVPAIEPTQMPPSLSMVMDSSRSSLRLRRSAASCR